MKKLWIACLSVTLLLSCLWSGAFSVAAEGGMNAAVSASSVTVGQSVTVTLDYSGGGARIGALDVRVSYDSKVLQYVSCTGATGNGGAGVVLLSWYATEVTAPTSVRITLTFKALAAGSGSLVVATDGFTDDDSGASLGAPSKSLAVTVNNPTASSNANLASLKPSSGTLTPKFSASTTEYTVTVPYTTTSLSLSAAAADKGAKVAVGGNNTLAVGQNTRVITVTAPSGATKKYTVIITRSAEQNTTNKTTTTTAPPAKDTLKVTVEGEELLVSDTQPETELPVGYSWENVPFQDTVVTAATNKDNETVLLWLTSAEGENGAFYLYDKDSGQFAVFSPITTDSRVYILRDLPANQEAPTGTVVGTCAIGELEADAFLYEDEALADFAILYVTAPDGKTGLYVYDRTDGSMQRYYSVPVPQPVIEETPETGWWQGVLAFVQTNMTVLWIAGSALLAVLIVVVVVIVFRSRRRRDDSRH